MPTPPTHHLESLDGNSTSQTEETLGDHPQAEEKGDNHLACPGLRRVEEVVEEVVAEVAEEVAGEEHSHSLDTHHPNPLKNF